MTYIHKRLWLFAIIFLAPYSLNASNFFDAEREPIERKENTETLQCFETETFSFQIYGKPSSQVRERANHHLTVLITEDSSINPVAVTQSVDFLLNILHGTGCKEFYELAGKAYCSLAWEQVQTGNPDLGATLEKTARYYDRFQDYTLESHRMLPAAVIINNMLGEWYQYSEDIACALQVYKKARAYLRIYKSKYPDASHSMYLDTLSLIQKNIRACLEEELISLKERIRENNRLITVQEENIALLKSTP